MSHQVCLKLPLLCMMIFSAIVGKEEQKHPIPNLYQKDISKAAHATTVKIPGTEKVQLKEPQLGTPGHHLTLTDTGQSVPDLENMSLTSKIVNDRQPSLADVAKPESEKRPNPQLATNHDSHQVLTPKNFVTDATHENRQPLQPEHQSAEYKSLKDGLDFTVSQNLMAEVKNKPKQRLTPSFKKLEQDKKLPSLQSDSHIPIKRSHRQPVTSEDHRNRPENKERNMNDEQITSEAHTIIHEKPEQIQSGQQRTFEAQTVTNKTPENNETNERLFEDHNITTEQNQNNSSSERFNIEVREENGNGKQQTFEVRDANPEWREENNGNDKLVSEDNNTTPEKGGENEADKHAISEVSAALGDMSTSKNEHASGVHPPSEQYRSEYKTDTHEKHEKIIPATAETEFTSDNKPESEPSSETVEAGVASNEKEETGVTSDENQEVEPTSDEKGQRQSPSYVAQDTQSTSDVKQEMEFTSDMRKEDKSTPSEKYEHDFTQGFISEQESTTPEEPVEQLSLEQGSSAQGNHEDIHQHQPDSTLYEKHEHPKRNPLLEHGSNKHYHEPECRASHEENQEAEGELSLRNTMILAMRHLSSSLISFLPEHLQDTILDVNDALVFTGIIALTLVSICVPYFFIETWLSARPLKKKVTDLNKTLWKVSTAFENQQEEYDVYKKKSLAFDDLAKKLEAVEMELNLLKRVEANVKDENRALRKRIKGDVKVAEELETLMTSTMNERDQVTEERDKLKVLVLSLQTKLKETAEELESEQADAASAQMDLQLMTHTNENLTLRSEAFEKEIGELKAKLSKEMDARRSLQLQIESLSLQKMKLEEELVDLKSVLHKYEETVSNLNDEISLKENELLALKETLGEDSPLVDIAEVTAKLKGAENQSSSLQARVESITIENSRLTRDIEKANASLNSLQMEKDQAETRLQVLEAYFKEKEEELRRVVERHEAEREVRGKDKDELVRMIDEKNDEVRDLLGRLGKLKEEFEETKIANRTQIRALEAKSHETWLSLCQSERKAQDGRKEAELLRQKLTAIAKAKEAVGHDALSSNGDVPYIFDQLDLDDVPLPIPEEPLLPSYFGLGDFEPPLPMDYDEDEDDTMNPIRRGSSHEPQRPPPLGQMSPTFPDLSPIRVMGGGGEGRDEYSDGSSSPPPPQGQEGSRENYMNGSMHHHHRQPLNASSPLERGFNL